MACSESFELIEWQAAEIFGGDLGQAYLGTQGDIWDAQKDSAMALAGALLGMACLVVSGRRQLFSLPAP
jgi:putative membrane protein